MKPQATVLVTRKSETSNGLTVSAYTMPVERIKKFIEVCEQKETYLRHSIVMP